MALPILIPIIVRIGIFGTGAIGLSYGIKKYAEYNERKYFNKGICKKCSGHFKYIEGTEENGVKGFKCDVCDNCIWIALGTDEKINYKYKPSKNAKS